MKIPQQFRVGRRPKEVVSRYAIIVVHNNGLLHQPLTTFYHELQQYVEYDSVRWPMYEPPEDEYDTCEECGVTIA